MTAQAILMLFEKVKILEETIAKQDTKIKYLEDFIAKQEQDVQKIIVQQKSKKVYNVRRSASRDFLNYKEQKSRHESEHKSEHDSDPYQYDFDIE